MIYLLHGLKSNNAVYLSIEIAKVLCPKILLHDTSSFNASFMRKPSVQPELFKAKDGTGHLQVQF